MIKEIRITNFGPYKEETIFDFTIRHGKNNTNNIPILKYKNKKILKIIGVFGKNASGKSVLNEAVKFISNVVLLKQLPPTFDSTSMMPIINIPNFVYNPNVFNQDSTTTFSICFIIENSEYNYTISYNETGIISEKLLVNLKIIFDRTNSDVATSTKQRFTGMANIASVFGIINHEKFPNKKECENFIQKINKIICFGSITETQLIQQRFLNQIFSDFEKKAQKKRLNLNDWLNEHINPLIEIADLSISGIYVNKIQDNVPNGIITNFIWKPIPTQTTNLDEKHLSINMSTGTKEYLFCLLALLHSDDFEYTIFWDELGSLLHPQLTTILTLLANESQKNNQLIFNSNQASIIKKLNRLQIFMIDRHQNNGSTIWKPKSKDAHNKSIYKAFLEGTIPGGPQIDWDNLLDRIKKNE